MSSKNANSLAWEKAVAEYKVLENVEKQGYADVTAEQLKVFREPRLMGKIDHEENLPTVFADHDLTILTTSNSSYRVGNFAIFQPLPVWQYPDDTVQTVNFPANFETLDINNLTSEAAVINAAHAGNMLQQFCGEELVLTVSGRMRTGHFDFSVDQKRGGRHHVSVANAQMEIDAGFEGSRAFYVFETKMHTAKNFNLRQLYYPTRSWSLRIDKPVVPIFLTYSNDVFDFYQFSFSEPDVLSSAVLTKHRRFMLKHEPPKLTVLARIADQVVHSESAFTAAMKSTPFPQADLFEKVIDLVSILLEEPQSADELASHYSFDRRQAEYYFNAAKFLGLATNENDLLERDQLRWATTDAEKIFALPYEKKYAAIAERALQITPLAETFRIRVRENRVATVDEVVAAMTRYPLTAVLSESTQRRRAQTLISWANWLYAISSRRT